jgi:L-amino acid N-acyltransferase YncA
MISSIFIERNAMSEPVFTFRLATPDDAEVLQAIYAPYVETTVTFEYVAPTVEEFRQRIIDRVSVYPYIVCEEDGVPVGYAYASRLYERAAYAWAVELSVYFAPNHRGRGMGRKIYDKMLSLLKLQGVRTVHGKVTFPNPASDKLHNAMGFKLMATLENVGFKNGEWRSINHWEKQIGDFSCAPEPITPITELDPAKVQEILNA